MATDDNEEDTLLGSTSHISSNSAVFLRRKSLCKQNAQSPTLSENNDDEERSARRREMNVTTTSTKNVTTNAKRHSFGLGFIARLPVPEITDRISQCIKLSAENKINIKNAFSLDIIDFMTYMIKKEDANMSSLQVASTSLDVSSKIYGYRVDGIHTELMKMVAGSDKNADDIGTDDQQKDMNATQGNQENGLEKTGKKRKKRNRQQIFSTVSGLKGTVEAIKPLFSMMEDADSQTTDALYQVVLPNHANSKFYLHFYNDVIVDTVEHNADMKNMEVSIPEIGDLSGLEFCPPLANFEFHGWSSDDKKEEDEQAQPGETNENRFQFDLNGSLPSDDETFHADMNYPDEPPEAGAGDACAEARKPVEKIVDFCKIVIDTGAAKVSEYSFLQKSTNVHWAGPSHWKISNCKTLFGGSKVIETCHQERVKKRKEIEIIYDEDRREAIKRKFALSKATRSAEAKTAKLEWYEETLTLPRDMHYTIMSSSKLYRHELLTVRLENKDQLDVTDLADGIEDYNYNNDNDTSDYCPNIDNDDYGANEDDNDQEADGFEDGAPGTHMIFTGDNLVSVPKLTNKICIAYSVRAKRIDMRQLKKSIWKGLISNGNKEDLNIEVAVEQASQNEMNGTKCFSEIYKALPDTLTKTNVDALSFPISFVSLLHLANEKILKLETFPDMSDIIIATN
ncbi:condensin complex subunit 2 [Andrena cerasifolii]|uniref:condensin complex subunit 2 n=1 Tax=Andrena cerasifolii TaxID=2819439 RepID=UPI004037CFED